MISGTTVPRPGHSNSFHPCKCSYPKRFKSQLQKKDQITCLPEANHILRISSEAQPITITTAIRCDYPFPLSPLLTSLIHPPPASSFQQAQEAPALRSLHLLFPLPPTLSPVIFRLFPFFNTLFKYHLFSKAFPKHPIYHQVPNP